MRKYRILLLSLFFLSYNSFAIATSTATDSISSIYISKNSSETQERVVDYLKKRYLNSSANDQNVAPVTDSLKKYDPGNADILNLFINTLINRRILKHTEARGYVLKAIALAKKSGQQYFLYVLYNQLAYIQTDVGDVVGAMYNYRLAKKQATLLNNRHYQAIMNLNISDLYVKVQFYKQALVYLDDAQAYFIQQHGSPRSLNFVYMNKVEAFYGLKQADSIKRYLDKLNTTTETTPYLIRGRTRLNSYLLFLKHDYPKAIAITKQLLKDTTQYDFNTDRWNLAKAYFANRHPDSAKILLIKLVSDSLKTPPQLKLQYYQLLAKIYSQESDYPNAYLNSELALQQSEKHTHNLVQLGDLSSQIKLEEQESPYQANALVYKREREVLLFGIVSLVLVVLVVVLFYYNTRQKRRYEQLLFATEKQKLAHMNSHEVRRHLSNILGLCILFDETVIEKDELPELYKYILESARQMDVSLKEVEQRLSENDFLEQVKGSKNKWQG